MEYPKLISWSYRNGKGIFSSKNDKDFILLYYVKNKETEENIKKLGYIPSNPFGPDYPFVTVDKEWGNTQRARSYGKIKTKFQKKYPDLEDKFLCNKAKEDEDLGCLIYTELSDSAKSLVRKYPKYFWTKYHIKKEAFEDKNFVSDLLNYKQKEGNEYKEKALPEFLSALKYYNKNLFNKLLEFEEVQSLNKTLSPIGQTAKVHTLKPSKVFPLKDLFAYSVGGTYFWDGKNIVITLGDKSAKDYNMNKLYFTPNEDYVVKITDEDSVTSVTEFIQQTI